MNQSFQYRISRNNFDGESSQTHQGCSSFTAADYVARVLYYLETFVWDTLVGLELTLRPARLKPVHLVPVRLVWPGSNLLLLFTESLINTNKVFLW